MRERVKLRKMNVEINSTAPENSRFRTRTYPQTRAQVKIQRICIRRTPSPKSTKILRLASRSPFSAPMESPVDIMELRDLPTEKPMTRSLPSYNVPDPVPIDTPATSKTNSATLTRLARYNVNGLNQPTTHNLSTYLLVAAR